MKLRIVALSTLAVCAGLAFGSSLEVVQLPSVDCGKTPKDARCKWYASVNDAGVVGAGPTFAQGGLDRVTSGFIDAGPNTLYVAVELGSQGDRLGAIFSVNLKNGDRKLVSGLFSDGTRRGQGSSFKNVRGEAAEGYDLGNVSAIRSLPNGKIAALVNKGTSSRTEILEVDPATGNRKLLWTSDVAPDTHAGGLRDLEGGPDSALSKARCMGGASNSTPIKPSAVFEVDKAGNFLLGAYNNPSATGIGILKVTPGGGCTWVSAYYNDGVNIKGDGAMVMTLSPFMNYSALSGDTLYTVTGPNPNGNALLRWNLSTAARDVLSLRSRVKSQSKGAGDSEVGYLGGFALGKSGFLTVMPSPSADGFEPVFVNAKTGERNTLIAKNVPLNSRITDSSQAVIAAVPNSNIFILTMKGGLYIYNVDTGGSSILSF
jgi:hypothetical protein